MDHRNDPLFIIAILLHSHVGVTFVFVIAVSLLATAISRAGVLHDVVGWGGWLGR
jgi:hypothetical protein